MSKKLLGLVVLGALGVGVVSVTSTPAAAQGRSCYDLWYERNEIYARNGYCFRTQRAISQFGPGCFPPYGRLSGWEARRVRDLQAEEDYRGCPR